MASQAVQLFRTANHHQSKSIMLIKALQQKNLQQNMPGHVWVRCVCVRVQTRPVRKTTTVQLALPLHGWTKTRRLRAATASLWKHS